MGGASFRSYGHEAFWFDQAERHYRMDMRTREVTTFDALTNTEKLRIALFEASFRVPGEAGTKLLGLLSTTNLAITASVLAIWVGSHATPLGWVVDITMVGVGLIAIGAEAADVAQELCLFANGIIDASDEIQCRMAASHLARAVAIIGVDVVLAILLKKAVFTMKSRFKAPEAVPVPELPAQQRTTPSQAAGRGDVPPAVEPKGGVSIGTWTSVNESMSARAATYQTQITGQAGQAYVVNGVKFDGFTGGVLIEAKGPGYATFVDSNGQFKPWFTGDQSLLTQAASQINAAGGTPIVWHVAEPSAATAIQNILQANGLGAIRVVNTLPK